MKRTSKAGSNKAGSKPKSGCPEGPGSRASLRELSSIREQIDDIDLRIHQLLNERARCAQQVGESKRGEGLSTADFYKPEREAQVLRNAIERNKGPLRNEEIVRLFREIMSACLAQQEPLKIAFLGPEGTFSQQAVLKHFGHSVRALPLPAISEVFEEVQAGHADFGVVPIENSTEGTVNHTLDMLLNSPLKICGEIELRIRQHLMGTHERPAENPACLLASAVAGAVPPVAGRAPAKHRARAGQQQCRSGASRTR